MTAACGKGVRGSPKHLLKYFIRLPKVLSCGRAGVEEVSEAELSILLR